MYKRQPWASWKQHEAVVSIWRRTCFPNGSRRLHRLGRPRRTEKPFGDGQCGHGSETRSLRRYATARDGLFEVGAGHGNGSQQQHNSNCPTFSNINYSFGNHAWRSSYTTNPSSSHRLVLYCSARITEHIKFSTPMCRIRRLQQIKARMAHLRRHHGR